MLSSLLLLTQRMKKFKTGILMLKLKKKKKKGIVVCPVKAMAALPLQMQLGSVYNRNFYKKHAVQSNLKCQVEHEILKDPYMFLQNKTQAHYFILEMLNIR